MRSKVCGSYIGKIPYLPTSSMLLFAMGKSGGSDLMRNSMYDNEDFVYSYGWNRVMMKIMGGWPEENDNLFMKYRIYVNGLIVLCLINLPLAASLTVLWGDLNAVIECLSVNLASHLALLKLVWIGIQRPTIQHLLKLMAEDWMMKKTDEEYEEMVKVTRMIRLISSMSFYGTLCLFVAYVSAQILLGIQLKDDPNIDPRLSNGFLYTCVFPFDTTSLYVFVPMWICQFFATYAGMASYSSADSFLVMFALHQCGQLKILRRRLERIVDSDTARNPRAFWRRLGEIVQRHEYLNQRSSDIEEHFNKLFLAFLLVCIFTTCSQGFTIITVMEQLDNFPWIQMIFLVVFTTYDVFLFFISCLAGDILVQESSNFGTSLYNSEWYNLASKEAKSILILTSRCTIPQKLTGGKFTVLSLPLFASIIKVSGSWLSVLLAMKE